MKYTVPAIISLFTLAGTALADGHIALKYEQFEVSVPHSDMADCPASMNVEKAFCRLTMHSEGFHVFAFSEEGDQPLIAFKSYEEGDFDLNLK